MSKFLNQTQQDNLRKNLLNRKSIYLTIQLAQKITYLTLRAVNLSDNWIW